MLYKLGGMYARRVRAEPDLTINDAAALLGMSDQTFRCWDKVGKLCMRRHPMNGYRLYPRAIIFDLKRRVHSPAGVTL